MYIYFLRPMLSLRLESSEVSFAKNKVTLLPLQCQFCSKIDGEICAEI